MTKVGDYRPRAGGIPWVRKEDYAAFVAVCEDGDDAPTSWEVFNQRSEEAECRYKADGLIIVRAYIDPETFPDWCVAHGYRVNAEGRKAFAAHVAAERHGKDNG